MTVRGLSLDLSPLNWIKSTEEWIVMQEEASFFMSDYAVSDHHPALDKLLNPRSIAIIGATDKVHQLNGKFQVNLVKYGFKGKVFPINPTKETINGLRCYPSILAIPPDEAIDAAIILLSAPAAVKAMEECRLRGVKGIVVFPGGFNEAGPQGQQLQRQLLEIAELGGMKICGPNCMGLINMTGPVVAYGSLALPDQLHSGAIGLVAQSGGMGGLIFNRDEPIPFSYLISVGNEANVDVAEYMAYLTDDPNTKVIAGYVEGFRDGKRFVAAMDRAYARKKPVVILKTGRSERGGKAVMAHTGSLAGSNAVVTGLFRQKGIAAVDDVEDLFTTARFFAVGRLPKGGRAGVLSISGGAIGLVSDWCERLGLELPEPSPAVQQQLQQVLAMDRPEQVKNPLDVNGRIAARPEMMGQSLSAMVEDPNYDLVICMPVPLTQQAATIVAKDIAQISQQTTKPIFVLWGAGKFAMEAFAILQDAGVPHSKEVDRGMRAIKALIEYAAYHQRRQDEVYAGFYADIDRVERARELLKGGGKALSERQSKQLLQLYGIPVTRELTAATAQEAVGRAEELGYPVVLKIDSEVITHKSDVGGVKLNLGDAAAVASAYQEIMDNVARAMPGVPVQGVLVQEMLPPGREIIVGLQKDPQFGPAVMVGLGGVLVEVLKDAVTRPAPLSPLDCREMLAELQGRRLLEGFRGQPPADQEAIVKVLTQVSSMGLELAKELEAIDINPLMVYPTGAVAADALVILQSQSPQD